jgi:hypothetical protein
LGRMRQMHSGYMIRMAMLLSGHWIDTVAAFLEARMWIRAPAIQVVGWLFVAGVGKILQFECVALLATRFATIRRVMPSDFGWYWRLDFSAPSYSIQE